MFKYKLFTKLVMAFTLLVLGSYIISDSVYPIAFAQIAELSFLFASAHDSPSGNPISVPQGVL